MRSLLLRTVVFLLAAGLAIGPAAAQAAPIALGVNVDSGPRSAGVSQFARLVGATPRVVMWYQSWSEPLLWPSQIRGARRSPAIPMITWAPQFGNRGVPLRAIAHGRFDAYVRTSALAAAGLRRPLFIRFGHEMNLRGSPYGPGQDGNRPKDFVAAWRHVVRLFRKAGASNVRWVWSPNVDCDGRCPFGSFYPGNSWVDWTGLDGYNYGRLDHMPWMSLLSIFRRSYQELRRISHKPTMIAETSSIERGGDKAGWIRQGFLRDIPRRMPAIRLVIWFNRQKETDWRVDSSRKTLRAFREVVRSKEYAHAALLLTHLL